jgi:anthranilate phosphoribosyltransferase
MRGFPNGSSKPSVSGSASNPLSSTIRRLMSGEGTRPDELTDAFNLVMTGEATPVQISALLVGLRVKGETPSDLASVVRSLRLTMVALDADQPEELVDTCGTGGGAILTFNISTAAALVAAGAGVRIAKHGNRSFTSECGSADVLEELGVTIDAPVSVMEAALREAGIVFMFAPLMHPAMRHVGPVRRELAVQTVMNLVGPLANPALAGRQVVGVADARRLQLVAGALRELGTVHALVVHGAGMDEVSPLGETEVVEIRDGTTSAWVIDPKRFGMQGTAEQLIGGSRARNAATVLRVLASGAKDVQSDAAVAAVVLNAAAALYVGGRAPDFSAAVELARDTLASGAGIRALERLRHAFATSRAN